MAKMDEEVRAMRAAVTALEGIEDPIGRARVTAYLFDRFVPKGMESRAIRFSIDEANNNHDKFVAKKQAVNQAITDVAHIAGHGTDHYTKHQDAAKKQWWECKVCEGTSPKKDWLPTTLEVQHETSCPHGDMPEEGEVEV
jgi:rubrerythrin